MWKKIVVMFNVIINTIRFNAFTELMISGPHDMEKNLKNNYGSVSILAHFQKNYEKTISAQMTKFFQTILSKYQCGFRKRFSTQKCLVESLSSPAALELSIFCIIFKTFFSVVPARQKSAVNLE